MAKTRSHASPPTRPTFQKDLGPQLGVLEVSLRDVLWLWSTLYYSGVLTIGVEHLILTLIPALTATSTLVGIHFVTFFRASKTIFLLKCIWDHGRADEYKRLITCALIVSMIGDIFFWRIDMTSFLISFGCYSVMHLLFIYAMRTGEFAFYGFVISIITWALWMHFIASSLTGDFVVYVPVYFALVCTTLWRGGAQPNYQNYGTKTCAVMGSVFFLTAHMNFSVNTFYLNKPFDNLNISTIVLFSMGQMLMAVSSFDEDKVFPEIVETKKAKKNKKK